MACLCVSCFACGSWTFFLVGFFFKSTLDGYGVLFLLRNLIPLFQHQLVVPGKLYCGFILQEVMPSVHGQLCSQLKRHPFMQFSLRFEKNGCLAHNSDWLKSM